MTTPLVVVGAGGFGREVLDVIDAVNRNAPTFHVVGVVDDALQSSELLKRRGVAHLGPVERLRDVDAMFVVGIGDPHTRAVVADLAHAWGREAVTLVHPAATMGFDVSLGAGTVVTAGVRITTNVVIGRHVHLNLNATIGHDAILGNCVTINPGATISGKAVVEDEVTIGTNAAVIQGVHLGRGAIVGAGAAVVRDVPPGVTAVGVPAKPLPR